MIIEGYENMNEVSDKPITNTLPTILVATLGISLGIGMSGSVLFMIVKAAQYYWGM